MNETGSKIFDKHMGKLYAEYNELSNAEKSEFYYKYNINGLFLVIIIMIIDFYHHYNMMKTYHPCHHHDEEYVKQEKYLKILTLNKLLAKTAVLFAQI